MPPPILGLNDPADPKDIDTSVVAYLLFNPAFGGVGDSQDPEVDALKHLKADFPPAIVFFGTGDGRKTGWATILKQLKSLEASSRFETWYAENAAHGYWDKPEWNNLNLIKADRFLVSLGLLIGEPTVESVAGSDKKLIKSEWRLDGWKTREVTIKKILHIKDFTKTKIKYRKLSTFPS